MLTLQLKWTIDLADKMNVSVAAVFGKKTEIA